MPSCDMCKLNTGGVIGWQGCQNSIDDGGTGCYQCRHRCGRKAVYIGAMNLCANHHDMVYHRKVFVPGQVILWIGDGHGNPLPRERKGKGKGQEAPRPEGKKRDIIVEVFKKMAKGEVDQASKEAILEILKKAGIV